MASLDSLPADQRAVLQLVLQRGRSYEDIAKLLSIDRGAVRQRALTALDTLGPRTGVPDDRRAMITDYLLGQLPDDQRDETHDRLAESPSERAWARVLASELAPVASQELPEIPVESSRAGDAPAAQQPDDDDEPADVYESEPELDIPDEDRVAPVLPSRGPDRPAPPPPSPETSMVPDVRDEGDEPPKQRPRRTPGAPSSRRGGMILIGTVVVIAVVVAAVLLLNTKSSPKTQASASTTSTTSTAAASTTTSSSTAAKVVAQINLTPPTAGSKAAGIAEVLKEGANDGIAIVAQNVPANTTKPPNAYAVWLYNSATDAHILGFVNPGVNKDGRLSTAGGLPANASHFKQLIVTVETQANPKTPGTVILQGALTGLS